MHIRVCVHKHNKFEFDKIISRRRDGVACMLKKLTKNLLIVYAIKLETPDLVQADLCLRGLTVFCS